MTGDRRGGVGNDPALVRLAQQAIMVVSWENAVDTESAAELIRDRAAQNAITIAELVESIVAVASSDTAEMNPSKASRSEAESSAGGALTTR